MTIKISDGLANSLLAGGTVKTRLDAGFIYFFAGAEPATADTVLDMVGVHTQLAKIAADAVPVDAGATGLTFAAAAASRALAKNAAETWASKVHFVGKDAAQAGVSALTAVFYRFCAAGDSGQAAGTGTTYRVQGTIGLSGADINLGNVALYDNGSNTVGLSAYELRMAP